MTRIFPRALMAAAGILSLAAVGCSTAPPPAAESKAAPKPDTGSVVRLDPALDAIVPQGAVIEKLAGDFTFLEGPLWIPSKNALWFADLMGNIEHQWTPDGKVTDVLNPGGYDGHDLPPGGYIGPNGSAVGPNNTIYLCQHGNRRIVTVSSDMKVTPLIDKFEGKKINSPNDLVFAKDGSLWFTDPPFGLPKGNDDPAKEQKFNGVYRWNKGKLTAVIKDVALPNGIAFSPDFKILYISNSDDKKRNWMRYDVNADGSVSNGKEFADATSSPDQGVPDGMRVDSQGNVYASGPGGIWVFSPDGKHLGTIKPPEPSSNCAWGDDGKTLYITATKGLYRIKLNIAGEKPVYE
jgi:gluconolactonase